MSPPLEGHLASTRWMNSWCLPGLPPGWVSGTPSPTPHPHPIALGVRSQLWLRRTRAGCTFPTLSPSFRVPPPSRNSLGWAFVSSVPRQCSWCCGLGRGWRMWQKARGRELSLSFKGEPGSSGPTPHHNASPKFPHWCLSK